ncbi:unnamed protein product [Rotaria sp. Silwood2]|nr:unnamed protein product [Rotaria sp. Silwood2]CAF3151427.1 unnamed protein product [Rotaria sp. Silwood2]CAF4085779.1 unnamed protein product [Rotaria sp. Silwood2]CAF4213302.1 unnamed protein product [Rotaria sp. Silwood2]
MFFFDCLGWMIDESTSRNVEKSPIIYVRYFENWESKTNFYEVLGLDGDDSIVEFINILLQAQIERLKLKCWQNLLDIPELNFKRLFNIRWTAIRDSIKPIMFNIAPTNQALLATLQEIKFGKSLTSDDRETAADLLSSILNDDSYSTMNNNYYGAFQIVVDDRDKLRFEPSKLQQYFLVLFEPDDLINNKDEVMKSNYGRQELQYIRTKYRNFSGFNLDKCRNEWETLKIH